MRNAHDSMPISVLLPQKLKPKTACSRRYLSRAYPLKEDEVEKIFYGLHKKTVVTVHVPPYLSASAHPATQSYASIRGTRSRRGTIVRKTNTATKEKS